MQELDPEALGKVKVLAASALFLGDPLVMRIHGDYSEVLPPFEHLECLISASNGSPMDNPTLLTGLQTGHRKY